MSLELTDFFCGAGGSSHGATAVPGVTARLAANHWARAIESHALNFPGTEHYQGDIHGADVRKFPSGDLFWASPECPTWSQARGKRRDYDKQADLFGETLPDEATDRSRALMWDVPKYLEAMQLRGRPVLAGVVENVTDVRAWIHWREWVRAIELLGYRTRLVAINSMHARPRVTPFAPQSRDRLYLAYWSVSLGRDPDWDRWLRPLAWCPSCEREVAAVQWWKRPGNDMGRYRQQYLYRCPRAACRGQLVEPAAMPAAMAIDWSLAGTRIGDRQVPLKPKTIARIEAGLRRYARPITLQTGGSDRYEGSRTRPVDEPLATQTATPTKALACPPLMVPAGGTWRDEASPVTDPMPARTTRENDGVTMPPFLTPLRSGRTRTIRADTEPLATVVADGGNHGLVTPPFLTVNRGAGEDDLRTSAISQPLASLTASSQPFGIVTPPFIAVLRNDQDATAITEPLGVVSTLGAHHALISPPQLAMVMRNNTPRGDPGQMCTPATEPLRSLTTTGHQSLITWEHLAHLLVPYYQTGVARPVSEPAGTVTTADRFGLASMALDVEDVLFRMLEPHEIGAAMAFTAGYHVLGSKRERVRQYGNAVTPPVAEVLISALVEAITGDALEAAA